MPVGQQKSARLDCCRAYRDKYGADMPTAMLAKIIYEENKLLFKDKEDVRYALRYIEGKVGSKMIKPYIKNSKYYMEKDRNCNPYSLPESDETNYDPFILNSKRVLLLSDIHIPYLNAFKQFMDILKRVFPSSRIIFKVGNHEERYQHFLWSKAAELTDVSEFDFENIIKARAEGIEYVSDKRIINLNGLNIIHGHEFSSGFFSPVNVARGLFLRAKTSAIQGHNHQTSEHTESDMNGKITTTWSTGCLSELHPAYSPINKWNHGFAIIDSAEDGFEVRNKRIFKGKVL